MIVVVVDGGGLTANETELEIFVRFARTFFSVFFGGKKSKKAKHNEKKKIFYGRMNEAKNGKKKKFKTQINRFPTESTSCVTL